MIEQKKKKKKKKNKYSKPLDKSIFLKCGSNGLHIFYFVKKKPKCPPHFDQLCMKISAITIHIGRDVIILLNVTKYFI